jgi:NDP-sugar pyrophosphorylase family protein
MFEPSKLFDLSQTAHASLFDGCQNAWEPLAKLAAYLVTRARPQLRNRCEGTAYVGELVSIGEGTMLEDGVMILGPAIIGRNCQIRHNAYIRQHVIIGDDCVVGNASEIKNSILFNKASAPHFNYVGDSIMGFKAHLGAGVKISNIKAFRGNVTVEFNGKKIDTGLRKFGALLGDHCEVGCNAVLSPGSILGRESVVYPNVSWRGVLPERMIVKNRAAQELTPRRAPGS